MFHFTEFYTNCGGIFAKFTLIKTKGFIYHGNNNSGNNGYYGQTLRDNL